MDIGSITRSPTSEAKDCDTSQGPFIVNQG
jgi:hypothetical protein